MMDRLRLVWRLIRRDSLYWTPVLRTNPRLGFDVGDVIFADTDNDGKDRPWRITELNQIDGPLEPRWEIIGKPVFCRIDSPQLDDLDRSLPPGPDAFR